VTVLPTPIAQISGGDILCQGQSAEVGITFQGTGNYTFEYAEDGIPQGQISTSDNPYLFDVSAGADYTLLNVTDDNCPGDVSGLASITVNPVPSATLSVDPTFCEGETGQVQLDLSGNGDWTVGYTIDGVNQPDLIINSNSFMLDVTDSGLYELTNVNDANCPGTVNGSSQVTINPLPSAILTGNEQVCEGESAQFNVDLTGTGPWSIEVSDGTNTEMVTAFASPYTYPVDQDGDYTLAVVSDSYCATNGTGAASLIVHPLPTANLSGNPVLCDGESDMLTVDLTGTPDFAFVYAIDGVMQPTMTSNSLDAQIVTSVEGAYELLEVSDAYCNGTATGLLNVQSVPLPTAEISGDFVICPTDTVELPIQLSGAADWTIQYSINGVSQASITTSDPDFFLETSDIGVYEIISVSDFNCVNNGIGSAEVDLFPPIDVVTSSDTAVCLGQVAIIDGEASGGMGAPYVFTWEGSDGNSYEGQTVIVDPNSTTVYVLTVSDGCEVEAMGSALVEVNLAPPISINSPDLEFCGQGTVTISNTTPSAFWDDDCFWYVNGDTIQGCESLEYTFMQEGLYDVDLFISSPGGCSALAEFPDLIQINPQPIAYWEYNPEVPTILENVVNFYDESHDADTYSWSVVGGEEFATTPDATYEFPVGELPEEWMVCEMVSNEFGCVDTLCLPVVVYGDLVVWMPNGFTPDGDGLNEQLKPVIVGGDPEDYVYRIWDRWGNLIFETNDIEASWNGKGAENEDYFVQDAVYVWQIVVKQIESVVKKEFKGHVTILR
jgi:gliding motility-associated-like protein